MDELTNLAEQYVELCRARDAATCAIRKRIAKAQAELDVVESQFRPKVDELEDRLKDATYDMGVGWQSASLKVKYRKPYTRATYDAKKLDTLCEALPSLRELIWPTRKETVVAASVSFETLD
jgi:hypothetical protein